MLRGSVSNWINHAHRCKSGQEYKIKAPPVRWTISKTAQGPASAILELLYTFFYVADNMNATVDTIHKLSYTDLQHLFLSRPSSYAFACFYMPLFYQYVLADIGQADEGLLILNKALGQTFTSKSQAAAWVGRQVGKTFSALSIIAALAHLVKRGRSEGNNKFSSQFEIIFLTKDARNLRQAYQRIYRALCVLEGVSERKGSPNITTRGSEHEIVYSNPHGVEVHIFVAAVSSDLRGKTFDVMIWDEFEFLGKTTVSFGTAATSAESLLAFYESVIAPGLLHDYRRIAYLSSTGTKSAPMNRKVTQLYREKLCNVMHWPFCCEQCIATGRPDMCEHLLNRLSSYEWSLQLFLNNSLHGVTRSSVQRLRFIQESIGMILRDPDAILGGSEIDNLFNGDDGIARLERCSMIIFGFDPGHSWSSASPTVGFVVEPTVRNLKFSQKLILVSGGQLKIVPHGDIQTKAGIELVDMVFHRFGHLLNPKIYKGAYILAENQGTVDVTNQFTPAMIKRIIMHHQRLHMPESTFVNTPVDFKQLAGDIGGEPMWMRTYGVRTTAVVKEERLRMFNYCMNTGVVTFLPPNEFVSVEGPSETTLTAYREEIEAYSRNIYQTHLHRTTQRFNRFDSLLLVISQFFVSCFIPISGDVKDYIYYEPEPEKIDPTQSLVRHISVAPPPPPPPASVATHPPPPPSEDQGEPAMKPHVLATRVAAQVRSIFFAKRTSVSDTSPAKRARTSE